MQSGLRRRQRSTTSAFSWCHRLPKAGSARTRQNGDFFLRGFQLGKCTERLPPFSVDLCPVEREAFGNVVNAALRRQLSVSPAHVGTLADSERIGATWILSFVIALIGAPGSGDQYALAGFPVRPQR